jgi:LemA protein
MAFIVLIVIVVLIALWVMGMYNRLVGLKNQKDNGWKQIDVQLKRRHDLIPNLVNTVHGAMEYERDTLTAVMDARSRAMAATTPADASRKEGELTQAIGRLFAVAENYPQLRANENVKMLQEELAGTENKIGFARQFYNDIATKYNIARETFPSNLIATSFNFAPAELFEITDSTERAVPTVDLSMNRPAASGAASTAGAPSALPPSTPPAPGAGPAGPGSGHAS